MNRSKMNRSKCFFGKSSLSTYCQRSLALSGLLLLIASPLLAEGSRELVNYEESQGGNTRYALQSSNDFGNAAPPLWAVFQVYAQAGETLHVGSNAIHTNIGNIYIWAPDEPVWSEDFPTASIFAAALVDCVAQAAGDTNIGLIDTRAKELAGPEQTSGDGGYVPCSYTAPTSGLYHVMFRATRDSGANAGDLAISSPTIPSQNTTGVHAWDVTIRDAGGADHPGRLTAPSLAFYETSGGGPDQQLRVLTREGHQYRFSFDELDGIGWFTFANNKGVQDRATGVPTLKSWLFADINDPADPQFLHYASQPDTATDFTHRLFVNAPDPLAVTGPGGLGETLGYSATPVVFPSATNFVFDGSASGGGVGSAPNGFSSAVFNFDSDPSLDGVSFVLVVDTDRNGSFDDAVDRRFQSTFDSAGNSLFFDGNDSAGNPLAFNNSYTARVEGIGAEVHFPLLDIENLGGMTIERLTDVAAGDVFRVHYDDLNGVALTTTTPTSLPEGGDSSVTGFHSWGSNSGNNDVIDMWTYTTLTGPADAVFSVGGTDLSITKTDGVTTVVPGGSTTYTLVASNLGPGTEPAASITDTFPAALTCTWTSAASGGATGNTNGAGNLVDTVAMPAGSSVTYTVTCAIDASATGTLSNTATISGTEIDSNPSNNSATDDSTLVASADLVMTKSSVETEIRPGDLVTWVLTVDNLGPSASSGASIMDTLAAGLTFETSADGCTAVGADVTCPVGALPSGGSELVTFQARAASDLTASMISNTATVVGNDPDSNGSNDASTTTVPVAVPVIEIPTLNTFGSVIMALLALAAAMWMLRRRHYDLR